MFEMSMPDVTAGERGNYGGVPSAYQFSKAHTHLASLKYTRGQHDPYGPCTV